MRAYWKAFLIAAQDVLAYRANTFFLLSTVIVPPLAVFFLWQTVLGGEAMLGAYTLRAMITYYIVTGFFVMNTPLAAWTDIGEEIRDGTVALWLVRPLSHYGLFFARVLGMSVPIWGLDLVGAAGVAAILHRYFQLQTDPLRIVAAVLLWLGGVVLGFTWGYLLNLVAFWTERSTGTVSLAYEAVVFLAGGVVPLDLLPVRELWTFLPFRFCGWLPTQVYLGRVALSDLPREFLTLFLWWAALFLLARVVWKRGLARFQGPGG